MQKPEMKNPFEGHTFATSDINFDLSRTLTNNTGQNSFEDVRAIHQVLVPVSQLSQHIRNYNWRLEGPSYILRTEWHNIKPHSIDTVIVQSFRLNSCITLANKNTISFQEGIEIVYAALNGFSLLSQIYGPIQILENMVFKSNGQWCVWLSSDPYANIPNPAAAVSDLDLIRKIINWLRLKISRTSQVTIFFDSLSKKQSIFQALQCTASAMATISQQSFNDTASISLTNSSKTSSVVFSKELMELDQNVFGLQFRAKKRIKNKKNPQHKKKKIENSEIQNIIQIEKSPQKNHKKQQKKTENAMNADRIDQKATENGCKIQNFKEKLKQPGLFESIRFSQSLFIPSRKSVGGSQGSIEEKERLLLTQTKNPTNYQGMLFQGIHYGVTSSRTDCIVAFQSEKNNDKNLKIQSRLQIQI